MATFKGIAFPLQKGVTSTPKVAEDADLIKQSILQIIMTPHGARVMRPDFGSRVLDFIFENNGDILAQQLRAEVFSCIHKWEPRAIVQTVEVEQEDAEVVITVRFVMKSTRQTDSLTIAVPSPQ